VAKACEANMPLSVQNYIDAWKDNAWVREYVSEWELDRKTGGNDSVVISKLHRMSEKTPDAALSVFVALAQQCAVEYYEEVAIAEELEWFLQYHGSEYWETVNALCSSEPRLRLVIANVWGASLPKDLKRKIEMWRS
jgi:hypothetical protein